MSFSFQLWHSVSERGLKEAGWRPGCLVCLSRFPRHIQNKSSMVLLLLMVAQHQQDYLVFVHSWGVGRNSLTAEIQVPSGFSWMTTKEPMTWSKTNPSMRETIETWWETSGGFMMKLDNSSNVGLCVFHFILKLTHISLRRMEENRCKFWEDQREVYPI